MNTTEGSSPSEVDDIARFVFIFIGSLEVVIGVAGNCLLLTVLLTRVRSLGLRSFHHYFIANLALSDLVTLGYWLTFFVLDLILGYRPEDDLCKANGFIIAVCMSTGVLSLMFISLNRYLHVCHNHLYRRVFTRARTIACCVCIWVFASLLAVPPLVNVSAYEYSKSAHICSFRRNNEDDTYPKAMIVIFAVVPMCVVGYLNYGIFRYWKMARLKLSTKYPLIRTAQARRKDVLEITANNTGSEMDTIDSEIQSEQNAAETADVDQSETSTSESEDEADESGASDEEASMSHSQGQEQQQDVKPLDYQPVRPPGNRHAANDLHKQNLQIHRASSVVKNVALKADESNNDSQVPTPVVNSLVNAALGSVDRTGGGPRAPNRTGNTTDRVNPGQGQSPKCVSSKKPEAAPDIKKPENEVADTICSRGRCQPQLAGAQTCTGQGPTLTGCKQLSRRRRKEVAREMAFVRSLCVVFFLMLFCFFPFGVAMVVDSFESLPSNVAMACNLVLFFHNSVNWIVYGVMNKSFRRGYAKRVRRVLRTCCPRLCARRHEEWVNGHKSTIHRGSTLKRSVKNSTWYQRSTNV